MAMVFFSYTHADETYRDRIEVGLSTLKRQGILETWHDRRIGAGAEFARVIDEHIQEADVILLLVSSDFIASEYCYGVEVTEAMRRHHAGSATVIPIIARPCMWHGLSFGKLLALPTDGRPISQFPDPDNAYLEIAEGIKRAIEARGTGEAPLTTAAAPREGVQADASSPRSSNLRLKRTFSDRDIDGFLDEAFAYIAKFFANSLDELARRNPGTEVRFKQLDAESFTATVYRDGRSVTECRIFVGSAMMMGKAIGFSENAGSRNSWNETLTVEVGDFELALRKSNLGFGRDQDGALSMEGAAEVLWARFIERLQ